MTHDWQGWEAQQPPTDFADRAVAAMLSTPKRRRRRRPRTIGLLSLAALLVGTAAWAAIANHQTEVTQTPAANPTIERLVPPMPLKMGKPVPVVKKEPPAPPVVKKPPTVGLPKVMPKPVPQPPQTAPSSRPDAGKMIMLPRCHCDNTGLMCSC